MSAPITAGELVGLVLRARGIRQARAAVLMDTTEKHLSAVITGRSGMSVEMAARAEHVTGLRAELLVLMQAMDQLDALEPDSAP